MTSMVTAAAVQGLSTYTPMGGWTTAQGASWDQVLMHNVADRTAAALVSTAINGGDLGRNLGNAIANGLLDTAASTSANWIGSNTTGRANAVAHAVAGCVVGAGRAGAGGGTGGGSGCGAGALGAVVGEATARFVNPTGDPTRTNQTLMLSQIMGGLAGAIVSGHAGVSIGAQAGVNAAENNWLNHNRPSLLMLSEQERYDNAVAACNAGNRDACSTRDTLGHLSAQREADLRAACAPGSGSAAACNAQTQLAQAAGNTVARSVYGDVYTTDWYPNGYADLVPFNTQQGTFHGAAAQSTADGIVALAPSVVPGGAAALWRWQTGIAPATSLGAGQLLGGSLSSGVLSAGTYALINQENSTPLGLAAAAAAGYVGSGITRRYTNYSLGFPHTIFPINADTLGTAALGAVTGYAAFGWVNSTGIPNSNQSWLTTPIGK